MIQLNKKILWAALIISLIGFADATYLTVEHFTDSAPFCSIIEGCNLVLESKFSEIFGVPVALFGAVFYLTIFFAFLYYRDTKSLKVLRMASLLTIAGLLASVYFVIMQFFMIKAVCQYCMLSAIISTILFILGVIILKQMKQNENNQKFRSAE